MVTCQICQHENPEGAEYCENCGASLEATAAPATAPAPSVESATPAIPETSPPPADATTSPSDQELPATAKSGAGQTEPLTGGPELDPPAAAMATDTDAAAAPAEAAGTATSTAATGANPRLTGLRYGAPTGDEYPLLGQQLVVGRFDSETGPVDIDLSQAPESEQISRQHAQLYRESDGRWFVKDLGSTNGVFVKPSGAATFGPRITTPQPLNSGDEVAFGNARFTFTTD
jgi:hypothetical protein